MLKSFHVVQLLGSGDAGRAALSPSPESRRGHWRGREGSGPELWTGGANLRGAPVSSPVGLSTGQGVVGWGRFWFQAEPGHHTHTQHAALSPPGWGVDRRGALPSRPHPPRFRLGASHLPTRSPAAKCRAGHSGNLSHHGSGSLNPQAQGAGPGGTGQTSLSCTGTPGVSFSGS